MSSPERVGSIDVGAPVTKSQSRIIAEPGRPRDQTRARQPKDGAYTH